MNPVQSTQHQNLVGFIWNIANKLRGPYRPPQYRRVMLPLVVLRRFDLGLADKKQKVLAEKKRLEDKGITGAALEKSLSRIAAQGRKQELYNTSRTVNLTLTLQKEKNNFVRWSNSCA